MFLLGNVSSHLDLMELPAGDVAIGRDPNLINGSGPINQCVLNLWSVVSMHAGAEALTLSFMIKVY